MCNVTLTREHTSREPTVRTGEKRQTANPMGNYYSLNTSPPLEIMSKTTPEVPVSPKEGEKKQRKKFRNTNDDDSRNSNYSTRQLFLSL